MITTYTFCRLLRVIVKDEKRNYAKRQLAPSRVTTLNSRRIVSTTRAFFGVAFLGYADPLITVMYVGISRYGTLRRN